MRKRTFNVIAVAIILIALFVLYYVKEGEVNYWMYVVSHRKDAGFEQIRQPLKAAFIKRAAQPREPQSYIQLGAIQMNLKDYASAERNFKTALKLSADKHPALEQLFSVHKAQKNYQAAEQDARAYAEQYSKEPRGYEQLIELYQFYLTDKAGELPTLLERAYQETRDGEFLILGATYYASHNDFVHASALLEQWLSNKDNLTSRAIIENLYNQYKSKIK